MKDYLKPMAVSVALFMASTCPVQAKNEQLRETSPSFFTTEEAARIGDNLLLFQRVTGGWPKNVDMCSHLTAEQTEKVISEKSRDYDSTTDNGATVSQLRYLARLYKATGKNKYRDSFRSGIEYLLSGQYAGGGWPQFWPGMRGYQIHITYNDNAMYNTLDLFRRILKGESPYESGLLDTDMLDALRKSFDKGIECILATQIVVDGKPTVWCQQHDRETLRPAPARAYELPSYCSAESAELVRLLMTLPNPDQRIRVAVEGAMDWFERNKLTGIRVVRSGKKGAPEADTRVVEEAGASPLWARFYDLDECRPFFCDRDGKPKRNLSEIGHERRNGYGWYNDRPASLYPLYEKWKARHGF